MLDLGIVRPGSTIAIPFSSFDKDDGSSVTMTNYAVGDILAYKDRNTTARASTAGFTATTDFSSKTGKHVAIIDLSENTTAGFWAAGSEYMVAIDAVTIDGVTTGGWIARFRIGYPGELYSTTLASLSSQTSFTLTVGPAEDDALNGMVVIIHDITSAVQFTMGIVLDYTGSTKTVTLLAAGTFTVASGDNITILMPTAADVQLWRGVQPNVLVSGRVDALAGAITNGIIVAATFAAGALDAVWSTAARALTDKAGFALSSAGVQAIWDALTSALTTVGSIGKLLVDNINTTISSRLATSGYTAPLDAAGTRAAVGLASANLDTQLSTIAGYIDTEVAAILAAVDTEVATLVTALTANRAEPGQGAPAASTTILAKVDYLYKSWRNKKTNDGTTTNLYADDATTVDQKQSTSEAAGTVTKGEWATGP